MPVQPSWFCILYNGITENYLFSVPFVSSNARDRFFLATAIIITAAKHSGFLFFVCMYTVVAVVAILLTLRRKTKICFLCFVCVKKYKVE